MAENSIRKSSPLQTIESVFRTNTHRRQADSAHLIRRTLKTKVLTVAKLRLGDLEKRERQLAEHQVAVADGSMTVDDALATYRQRLEGDASIKPRTREYHEQRITALFKSWPELKRTEVRGVTKTDCLNWAARFGKNSSATAFNHTIGILKRILEVGVESGVRYDNPARFIKRRSEKPKKPELPEIDQFDSFVAEIEDGGARDSRNCAALVRFLACGGFRKTESANIIWADCDFVRGRIVVRGDPETGTKNSEIREVPMIPDMRQRLERLRAERPDESLETPVMRVRECQKAMDRAAKIVGMHRITHHDIELHTGAFAEAFDQDLRRKAELERLVAGAKQAHALGLKVNPGHGLNYHCGLAN